MTSPSPQPRLALPALELAERATAARGPHRVVGLALALLAAGCAGSGGPPRATDGGSARLDGSAVLDADATDAGAPDAAFTPRCGDSLCTAGVEDCETCALDCGECPVCDMAPTCTGALAVPTTSTPLDACGNEVGGDQRTNYACGTDLGVPPSATDCADPQLRIRVRQMSIFRGNTDIPSNLYCVLSAEDGSHSELLLTPPRSVDGWHRTTEINLRPSEGLLWGQGDLYRSTANVTITYQCYLASDASAAMRVLDDLASSAAAVAEHADGYGWVFGTASVVGTLVSSALGTTRDRLILDVQQTIDAGALLTLTNARTWDIHRTRGNFLINDASDLRLTIESWGCADVRPTPH